MMTKTIGYQRHLKALYIKQMKLDGTFAKAADRARHGKKRGKERKSQ